jgi:hypothetical protein
MRIDQPQLTEKRLALRPSNTASVSSTKSFVARGRSSTDHTLVVPLLPSIQRASSKPYDASDSPPRRPPEVPLSHVRRRVAGPLQQARQRRVRGVEELRHAARLVLFVGRQVAVQPQFGRPATGHQCTAGRRTDGASLVVLCEKRTLTRQTVDRWRVEPRVPVTARIAPTEVVRQNEENVGPRLRTASGPAAARAAQAASANPNSPTCFVMFISGSFQRRQGSEVGSRRLEFGVQSSGEELQGEERPFSARR